MPLEIDYRPVVLPTAQAARGVAAPIERPGEPIVPEPRSRAYVPPIPKRARVSLRQWIAAIVLVGAVPALLAISGWGNPRGIAAAAARTDATPAEPRETVHAATTTPIAAPLADVHSDAVPAPAPALPTGPVARPTVLAGSMTDHARALQCLTAAIYYEAAREPDDGQRAVAQVVLNRLAHPAFPKTVCGVVYQGSERPGCQFSFACDGSMARPPMLTYWARARRVAEAALGGYVHAAVGLATHYHTSAVHPGWADTMTYLGTIGAHRFYRWGGSAGDPRAFNAVYRGSEPVPAPHPQSFVSTRADFADPLVLQKAFEAGRLAALRAAQIPASALRAAQIPAISTPMAVHATQAAPVRRDILPGSGTVRSDAAQQYDSAAHWIHQPGA